MPNSCLVYGCFHSTKAELSCYDRNCMGHQAWKIHFLALYRKILPILELNCSSHALSCHHSWSFEPRKIWSLKGNLYQPREKWVGIKEGGDWNWRGKSIEGSSRTDRKNVLSTRRSGIGGSCEDTELVSNLGFFFTVSLFQSAFFKNCTDLHVARFKALHGEFFLQSKIMQEEDSTSGFSAGRPHTI